MYMCQERITDKSLQFHLLYPQAEYASAPKVDQVLREINQTNAYIYNVYTQPASAFFCLGSLSKLHTCETTSLRSIYVTTCICNNICMYRASFHR